MVLGMRLEDRLEGASYFEAWKLRMMLAMKKHDLLPIISSP